MSKPCYSCGKELADDAQFCDNCGASFVEQQAAPQAQQQYQADPQYQQQYQADPQYQQQQQYQADPQYQQQYQQAPPPPGAGFEEVFSPEDIEKNKTMAGFAYIIFFLPLLACPESRFARFHANQALVIFLLGLIGGVINVIPVLGCIVSVVAYIAVIVFIIMGMINAFGGKAKQLPLVGKIKILK